MKHDHAHDHSHHAPQTFNLAFGLSVALNFGFTIIVALYAIIAHSMSLLADAGHNLGDVLGLLLAWGANWLLTKRSSERYSYGFKRLTIIAAIANATILIAASAIIAFESIQRLFHPVMVAEKIVIVVAFIGIIINSGTALLFMRGSKSDLNIKGAFLHLASDALVSLGVVVAGIAILYTKAMWIDPLVGLLIVITILLSTWGLLRDSINLMLDAVPKNISQKLVKQYLAGIDGVTEVHDIHIWGLSTREVALTAHLIIPDRELYDADFEKINYDLLHEFKINHVTIQVEKGTSENPCGQGEIC
ncbi:MAG: cation diffusion facilitator family transporter [Gammaproteobacteria bacterium]